MGVVTGSVRGGLACSKAQPRASRRASLNAGPMNDQPTGNAGSEVKLAETIESGQPVTFARMAVPA